MTFDGKLQREKMQRCEISVPLVDNEGNQISQDTIDAVKAELLSSFGSFVQL
jgi:hypothetical protein